MSCEVCGERLKLLYLSDSSKPFARCRGCGLLQSMYKQFDSRIEEDSFFNYVSAQDESLEDARRRRVASQLKNMVRTSDKDPLLFDIGTGAGKFLSIAREQGFQVSGNELSQTAIQFVRKNYGIELYSKRFEDLGFVSCLDVVTMFCVLAHIVDPKISLSSIHAALNHNGVLYLHTPRYCLIDSIALLILRCSRGRVSGLFNRRLNDEHKRVYSRKALEMLLLGVGLEIEIMRPETGFGLKKEHYFTSMGVSRYLATKISFLLNFLDSLGLLPRNVWVVYARKHV